MDIKVFYSSNPKKYKNNTGTIPVKYTLTEPKGNDILLIISYCVQEKNYDTAVC